MASQPVWLQHYDAVVHHFVFIFIFLTYIFIFCEEIYDFFSLIICLPPPFHDIPHLIFKIITIRIIFYLDPIICNLF